MLAGLSAAGGGQQSVRSARSVAGQVAFTGVSGACVGAYLMWEFFPGEPPLQVGFLSPYLVDYVFLSSFSIFYDVKWLPR